jgi:ornithine cyclodeaminase
VAQVHIASRSPRGAEALADYARTLGLEPIVVHDPDVALADCPLVVTCTPASGVVLRALPRGDAFIAAVGAFTPAMVELAPELCRHFAAHGSVVVDTPQAQHEAGDLLQAGLDVCRLESLREIVLRAGPPPSGPVLFKSCGWAGWDLAAARAAIATGSRS